MDNYNIFKQGFLNTVGNEGYDKDFLEAFLKKAEEIQANWQIVVDNVLAQQENPTEFCKSAFEEIALSLDIINPMTKQAAGEEGLQGLVTRYGPKILGLLNSLGGKGGNTSNPGGMGGALAGGGGGLILGLILSQLFNIPLHTALLLGTLGGGALGYGLGGTNKGRAMLTGDSPYANPPDLSWTGGTPSEQRAIAKQFAAANIKRPNPPPAAVPLRASTTNSAALLRTPAAGGTNASPSVTTQTNTPSSTPTSAADTATNSVTPAVLPAPAPLTNEIQKLTPHRPPVGLRPGVLRPTSPTIKPLPALEERLAANTNMGKALIGAVDPNIVKAPLGGGDELENMRALLVDDLASAAGGADKVMTPPEGGTPEVGTNGISLKY